MHSKEYIVRSLGARPAENLSALAALINAAHRKAGTDTHERLEWYLAAGRELLRAKAEVVRRNGKKRGSWLAWLRTSCPDLTRLKAWQLMRFAECSASKPAMSVEEQWQEWRRISGHLPSEEAAAPEGGASRVSNAEARCHDAHHANRGCRRGPQATEPRIAEASAHVTPAAAATAPSKSAGSISPG
jgi:hypothetical protein